MKVFEILYASRPRRGQTSVHDRREILGLKLGEIRGVRGAQNRRFGVEAVFNYIPYSKRAFFVSGKPGANSDGFRVEKEKPLI